jgi:predicted TIM-barrel fold metal-dependent hydrolase
MSRSKESEIDPTLIISSDGHAMPNMAEYRPYLPSSWYDEFDAFCEVYKVVGQKATDAANLSLRLDPDSVEKWTTEVVDTDLLEGVSDPVARIRQQDNDGIAAEVLFPDFGLPFQMSTGLREAGMGYKRSPEQIDIGNRCHNRWVADFCASAPERFIPMACVSFHDVEAAVKEIRWAHETGFKGVMLPFFDDQVPLFDPRHEPIWRTVEELGMPLNSHVTLSSTTNHYITYPSIPHPACAGPLLIAPILYFCHQILNHMIWGGVLENHPDMKVVFTEQGSGWVLGALQSMDYSYDGSYLRRDTRDVVRHRPSEYFERQCFLGSSIFSRAEVEARHEIGLGKMSLGMDYPHHEGTWAAGPGTLQYLKATLGAAKVPANEARMLLSQNAAKIWNVNLDALGTIAEQIGPSLQEILSAPTKDEYPRGDVHKPLTGANF